MAGKAPISTTMRSPGKSLGNTSLSPETAIQNQYYGTPHPVNLPDPAPGTGQPLNGGRIDKNFATGGMKK